MQNEPPEFMPWAAVNAENEKIRNSAGNGIRMTDSGRMKTTTGKIVLYSGREDNSHHGGAAIIHDEERIGKVLNGMKASEQQDYSSTI